MKKWIAVLLLAGTVFAAYGQFCNGYKRGYKEGYCYRQFGCIEPITPICPIPDIGENSWSDGYNRGFLDGINAQ